MAIESQPMGEVRVAKQVLSTIAINSALLVRGVARMAQGADQWSRLLGREIPRQGVALSIKDNIAIVDLYIVVNADSDIVAIGSSVQDEVASSLEEMVGLHVHEVNVYIQDVV